MSAHNSSVFNNTCLKVPRNPNSQQPSPIYEQKYINHMQNEAIKLNLDKSSTSSPDSDKSVLKSFIEFYDSIPEYDDINHLSNKDFYRKVQNLKDKQQTFCDYIQRDYEMQTKSTNWIEDYKNLNSRNLKKHDNNKKKYKPAIKQFCSTPTFNKVSSRSKNLEDVESIISSDKEIVMQPPSRRSVRIESPSDRSDVSELASLPRKSKSPGISKNYNDFAWDDLSLTNFKTNSAKKLPPESRSAPNSPTRLPDNVGWKENGITIPKPFQMTVRDEENKIVDEVIATVEKPKQEKSEMFRANPVPIESRIPLFNKIVEDQERRSQIVKQRSKENLRSQMRPFSFTRREELSQLLSNRWSKSSPSIFLEDIPPKTPKFRAKPVPKGLFSNYIYHKMHEDEFYRALQRKIRSEEMLKSSSLPPSMAKRERTKPKFSMCPRSIRSLEKDLDLNSVKSRLSDHYSDFDLDRVTDDYINDRRTPSKIRRARKRYEEQLKRCYGNALATNKNTENYRASSAADLLSVNKSNLAAVLRIQSAKKKMQVEMCRKLEESKIKEESRWREKVLRKRPAWQKLAYSHEEDLEMRLQLRRDEERLRNEEHKHRMELMFGRVNQMPMLFERHSQMHKYPITREELVDKLHEDYLVEKYSHSSTPSSSDKKTIDSKEQETLDKLMKTHITDN